MAKTLKVNSLMAKPDGQYTDGQDLDGQDTDGQGTDGLMLGGQNPDGGSQFSDQHGQLGSPGDLLLLEGDEE